MRDVVIMVMVVVMVMVMAMVMVILEHKTHTSHSQVLYSRAGVLNSTLCSTCYKTTVIDTFKKAWAHI